VQRHPDPRRAPGRLGRTADSRVRSPSRPEISLKGGRRDCKTAPPGHTEIIADPRPAVDPSPGTDLSRSVGSMNEVDPKMWSFPGARQARPRRADGRSAGGAFRSRTDRICVTTYRKSNYVAHPGRTPHAAARHRGRDATCHGENRPSGVAKRPLATFSGRASDCPPGSPLYTIILTENRDVSTAVTDR
jgi:hypothetical protein